MPDGLRSPPADGGVRVGGGGVRPLAAGGGVRKDAREDRLAASCRDPVADDGLESVLAFCRSSASCSRCIVRVALESSRSCCNSKSVSVAERAGDDVAIAVLASYNCTALGTAIAARAFPRRPSARPPDRATASTQTPWLLMLLVFRFVRTRLKKQFHRWC